jgi:hypothetical protein
MTLEQKIDKVLEIAQQQQRSARTPAWVGFSFIKDLTGWNAEKRRQAVKHGIMKKKKGENLYDANSIPERFLKKQIV